MRGKPQELDAQVVEEQADEWRPQKSDWLSSPESARADLRENSASPRTITICVTEGRSKHKTHRLKKSRVTIGSGGGADMRIDDSEISPIHCAVAVAEDGVRIYDLDSANGTYIDDERIQMANLENLSVFRLGSTEFAVLIVRKLDGA